MMKLKKNLNTNGQSETVGCSCLKLGENVARIILNPQTKQTTNITVYQENLRFKCKQCATFCCKLGGPNLTKGDIERIKQAGYKTESFLGPVQNGKYESMIAPYGCLRSKKDGSCIFLKLNHEKHSYECTIYCVRPILCRIYPFQVETPSPNRIVIKIISCCRGLNNADGELVDKRFITNHIVETIFNLNSENIKKGS
jgi:Fe-S-cluster containining protein